MQKNNKKIYTIKHSDLENNEERFSMLRNSEIIRQVYIFANMLLNKPKTRKAAFEKAQKHKDYPAFKAVMHQLWIDYIDEISKANQNIQTIAITQSFLDGNLFPLEQIQRNGYEVVIAE